MTPDPIPGVLAKLTDHQDQITELDTRETSHHTATTERLTQITDLVTAVRRLLDDHQAALTRIENLDGQGAASNDGRYRPGPAATWWKLTGAERQEPIAQLQVVSALAVFSAIRVAVGLPCWEAVPSHVVPRQAAARRR
jgi:hypothetical protein